MLDIDKIRGDFPILQRRNSRNKSLVYLDNAATTQKPYSVIQSIENYYTYSNANIHRGVHDLAQEATQAYERARQKVQEFIQAPSEEEIIFVKGTTEAINLVASAYLAPRLQEGDEILLSAMEHHANLIPWQITARQHQANLSIIPINQKGEINLGAFEKMLHKKVKMLALVHISNSLGTINPAEEMIAMAHKKGIPVLLDGAQSVGHQPLSMQELDCDFFAFSGHKLFAPTGVGVLFAKKTFLENMEPYQYGGEMIRSVSFEESTFAKIPHKFEAGTPNIAGAIALGAAIDYLSQLGMKRVQTYTNHLLEYATEKLSRIPELKIIGQAEHKSSIVSFLLGDVHPHDIGTVLNEEGIAIRAGHHCTMPLMQYLGIPGTARASFSIYNTADEIDFLAKSLLTIRKIFS
ncbi:MAG: cysteine desulfurase [Microscillaceae bacterium]|nr:cysteine desulfurase [Microscillaceae bacterium]